MRQEIARPPSRNNALGAALDLNFGKEFACPTGKDTHL
jgi:hypothetical protein